MHIERLSVKKDIIYISVHNSNNHAPSPSGILKARYLRFLNIFNFSITNLNIHFRFYKRTPPWNMCIIILKNYSFKELKKIASIQETSFSLLGMSFLPRTFQRLRGRTASGCTPSMQTPWDLCYLRKARKEEYVSRMKNFLQLGNISEASAQVVTPWYLQCLDKPLQLNKLPSSVLLWNLCYHHTSHSSLSTLQIKGI